MTASNRQTLILKVQKVLKNHYKPVKPPAERSVLEHLLYACCLENSHFEAADEGFAKLQQCFFDWNEVRVTTVTELAETLACLADPPAAATRLKRCLQSVFEAHYAFDLESLKKQNLGKAVKDIEGINGVTPFVVAYVVQNGLGGHSIPCSQGVFKAFEILEIITPAEAAKGRVPGLERAISKSKGADFASLLHQLGADFFASPSSAKVRSVLTEISPDAKDRLPKRASKGEAKAVDDAKKQTTESVADTESAEALQESGDVTESEGSQRSETGKKKQVAKKQEGTPAKATRKTGTKKSSPKPATSETKKSTTKQLSRKKPR